MLSVTSVVFDVLPVETGTDDPSISSCRDRFFQGSFDDVGAVGAATDSVAHSTSIGALLALVDLSNRERALGDDMHIVVLHIAPSHRRKH